MRRIAEIHCTSAWPKNEALRSNADSSTVWSNAATTEPSSSVLHPRKGYFQSRFHVGLGQVAMADTMLRVLRRLTADPQCAIHASIAGGRKSMSFYMGYAMSLLARPQDRMSHVLVTQAGYEHPAFFYPTREPQPIPQRLWIQHSEPSRPPWRLPSRLLPTSWRNRWRSAQLQVSCRRRRCRERRSARAGVGAFS